MDSPGVVLLSQHLGLPVVTPTGERLGRVADLTVRLGEVRPVVHRLLVKAGRSSGYALAWADVGELVAGRVLLREEAEFVEADLTGPALDAGELLLARDVLDTQVVDLRGHRLSRVSDVLLTDSAGDLQVVGVDLGSAALLRRLGLGAITRGRPMLAVDWADLHLTSPRGHQVQLTTTNASFQRLDAAGLAELLARLGTPPATDILRAVEPAHAAAALHRSHTQTGHRLLRALSADEQQELTAAAAAEHAQRIGELGRPLSPLRHRRFMRTSGWRAHRPPGSGS